MYRLPLAACLSLGLALPATAQDASDVVATVGDTEITLGHMIAFRESLPQQYQSLDDATLFQGILDQLVQQVVVGANTDELSTRAELTLENQRRALLASQVVEAEAADAVTEEEVRAEYESRFGDAEAQTEYNAAHILVETEEEAQALLDELEGGADFAALAEENSTGPSGPSGGALGWFGAGAMVPAFQEAVEGMEPGGLAGPIETQFGWHVIRLNETREVTPPSFEEVQADIEASLQAQAVEEIIAQLSEGVEVTRPDGEVDPSLIRNDDLISE